MWTNALKAGKKGKEAALHAALGILSSPPPPSANAATGTCARHEPTRYLGSLFTTAVDLDLAAMCRCDNQAHAKSSLPEQQQKAQHGSTSNAWLPGGWASTPMSQLMNTLAQVAFLQQILRIQG